MRKKLDNKIAELGGKGPVPVELPPVDTVHESIDIKATPDEVFHVATDFLEYPKWAGAISSVKIVQGGHPPRTVDFRMGMFGITLNNRFKYTYSRPGKVDWYAAPGSSVKELVGAYRFKATAGGTRAEYSLLVDPGFPLPSAIRKATSRAIVNAALKDLKRHTELPSTLAKLRGGAPGRASSVFGSLYLIDGISQSAI